MPLVPFSHRRIRFDLFEHIAPPDTRVVRAKADFAHLRPIRDDAHLRAPKIVIEQVLKPHARDEQHAPLVLLGSGIA